MSIVKLQTSEASEPLDPTKQHYKFQSLLDRIALLFVREPIGEVYSVVVAHPSSAVVCPYDQRDPKEFGSENNETRTILYLCPNTARIQNDGNDNWYGLRPLL
jgi:hypothetical protein